MRGGSVKGVLLRGCHEGTPPLLVNKWAVCIILECFLVWFYFSSLELVR